MPLKMKELPVDERPYEKLEKYGEKMLSNAELLAIIIKTGTKEENSIEVANRILLLSNSLKDLQNISITELEKIKGIGKVKAIQLKAICELAKRMSRVDKYENQIYGVTVSKRPVGTFGKFKEISEAYEILSNENKRYDEYR